MELWVLCLGVATGMRTMTAMAALCWFAYLNLLPPNGWTTWTANLVSVIVFSLLALGEYVGDTLPQTPSRLAIGPLSARLVFGALAGAIAAHALLSPVAGGVLIGVLGVLIGAFGGHRARMALTRRVGRDLPVALCESAVALALALWAVRTLHQEAVVEGFAHRIHGIPLMRF
jgi:uncharacterized membrane protein